MLRNIFSALLFSGLAFGATQAQAQYGYYDCPPPVIYPHASHFHAPAIYHNHHVYAPIVPSYPMPAINAPACYGGGCNHNQTMPAMSYNPNVGNPRTFENQGNADPGSTAGNPALLNQIPTVIPNPNSQVPSPANSELGTTLPSIQQGGPVTFAAPQQDPQQALPSSNAAVSNSPAPMPGLGSASIMQDDSPLMSGSEQLGSIDRGQELQVLNIQGNWVQLETSWLKANTWIRKDLVQLNLTNPHQSTDIAPPAN